MTDLKDAKRFIFLFLTHLNRPHSLKEHVQSHEEDIQGPSGICSHSPSQKPPPSGSHPHKEKSVHGAWPMSGVITQLMLAMASWGTGCGYKHEFVRWILQLSKLRAPRRWTEVLSHRLVSAGMLGQPAGPLPSRGHTSLSTRAFRVPPFAGRSLLQKCLFCLGNSYLAQYLVCVPQDNILN